MKTRVIKSAVPIYIAAVLWILYGLALPLYKWRHIILATGLSIIAYFVAKKFFPDRTVEVENLSTGNVDIDRELENCKAELDRLQEANKGIPDKGISEKIDRMEAAGNKILKAVVERPSRFDDVRKFMRYYLPTTTKLLEQYKILQDTQSQGQHVTVTMQTVEKSLDLIAGAFEKQLDNLYKNEALDIKTDVKVLESMMAQDGLLKAGVSNINNAQ